MTAYDETITKWETIENHVKEMYKNRAWAQHHVAVLLLREAQTLCPLCKEHEMICYNCPIGKISPCLSKDSLQQGLTGALGCIVNRTVCKWPYKLFFKKMEEARKALGLKP